MLPRVSAFRSILTSNRIQAHHLTSRSLTTYFSSDPSLDNYPKNRVIRMADFRSDTVTKPTAEMSLAMMDAVVGDDVYNEDPTVNKLQITVAELFGKEAALFVPSGTMGNLLSVSSWANRGDSVIVGDECHIYVYEQCGVSQLFGIALQTIPNHPDGTFNIRIKDGPKSLEKAILDRAHGNDVHYVKPTVVTLEQTHNRCGGTVLSQDWIDAATSFAHSQGLKVHMDGARIFNAAAVSGLPVSRIVRDCDSVSVCLSKGVGAPVGSVIVGPKDFIAKCKRTRKTLGGGMRQAGILAAACLVGLESIVPKLSADHMRAKLLAATLASFKGVGLQNKNIETNIVFFDIDGSVCNAKNYLAKKEAALAGGNPDNIPIVDTITPETDCSHTFSQLIKQMTNMKIGAYGSGKLRMVTHHQITDKDIDLFLSSAEKALALMRE
jgi:threonine aldolase